MISALCDVTRRIWCKHGHVTREEAEAAARMVIALRYVTDALADRLDKRHSRSYLDGETAKEFRHLLDHGRCAATELPRKIQGSG